MSEMKVVPVKSAWASKINWTALASGLIAIAVALGLDIPDDVKSNILTGVVVVQSLATWIFKTWFTTSITKSSA